MLHRVALKFRLNRDVKLRLKKTPASFIRRKYESPVAADLLFSRSFWKEGVEFLKKGLTSQMPPLVMAHTEVFKYLFFRAELIPTTVLKNMLILEPLMPPLLGRG